MPETYEKRTVTTALELRGRDNAPELVGYASTFMQPYDLGAFREQVAHGAFARTLGNSPDVRLLVDHEGQPLARTKSGTLTLAADSTGLHVRAELDPSDPDVQRLLPKMRRGDLDQMSFAFRVPTGGDTWSDDYSLRTIREANLAGGDVSVVTYPANDATSATVRATDLREAQVTYLGAVFTELRDGRTLSAATVARLQAILASLAGIDAALDTADDNLDTALADLADVLGTANPDPAEEPAMQANSLPLDLVLAAKRSRDRGLTRVL